MGDRFRKWMQGRYVTDQLNRFLSLVVLILLIIALFVHNAILNIVIVLLLVWEIYRTFSRDIERRRKENQIYLNIVGNITGFFHGGMRQAKDRNHLYFRCPNCGQRVRVPRYKGHIEITCPKCRTKFVKDTGKMRG